MKNSSILTASVDFTDYISGALDKKRVVKFDVVTIDNLLNKLFIIGITGVICSLVKTHLLGRNQYIKLKDTNTE